MTRLTPSRLIGAGALIVALVLTGLIAAVLIRGYDEAIADAERRTSDFADFLSQQAVYVFDDVDRTLEVANVEREKLMRAGIWGPHGGDLPYEMLREVARTATGITNLSWADEHGERIYSAAARVPTPLNVNDLPHFSAQRDRSDLGLYIGPPTVSTRTGQIIVPVSRRFEYPAGHFAGVSTALVDPIYFRTAYRTVMRSQKFVIQLLLRDGTVLVQEPPSDDAVHSSLAATDLFTKYLPQASAATFRTGAMFAEDGGITSFRASHELPLVVSISMSTADALASWRWDSSILGAFWFALMVLIAVCMTLLISHLRERERHKEAAEAAKEAEYRAQKLQALSTLVSGISHEINNALTPILALGEMAQESLPEASAERESIAQMLASAEQINALIQRLLAFSRKEQATGVTVDVTRFAARLAVEQGPLLPQHIKLLHRTELGLAIQVTSEEKLKQVFVDLIKNAAEAIGESPGHIEITAAAGIARDGDMLGASRDPGQFVLITVRDDGPGMAPIVKQRLFEPFFTTKAPGAGVGLGLFTARQFVTEIGGFMDVQSEFGNGACVSIYFPRAMDRSDAIPEPVESRAAAE